MQGVDAFGSFNTGLIMSNNASISQRFLFDNSNVRGEHISLHEQWQIILKQRDYPPVVQQLLAEALACSVLITSTLKFTGRLNLQIQSTDGDVSLLVVQVKTDNTFRATADWTSFPDQYDLQKLFGSAHLLIALEQNQKNYQAVVELTGKSLTQCIEGYFLNSEQLETKIWVANKPTLLAGLLLQKLPDDASNEDTWQHAQLIADTLQSDELLKWNANELLSHLYPEDNIRLFDAEFWQFKCSCSQERIEGMVKSLGEDEAQGIIKEQGTISVDCEFCHQHYQLDAIEVTQLFTQTSNAPKLVQ